MIYQITANGLKSLIHLEHTMYVRFVIPITKANGFISSFFNKEKSRACYLRKCANNFHELKLHTYICSLMHLLSLFCLFYCFLSMHGFLCIHVISKATAKSASGSNLIINTGEYTSIHIDIGHTICKDLKSIVKCSSSWSLKTKRAKPSSSKQSQ